MELLVLYYYKYCFRGMTVGMELDYSSNLQINHQDSIVPVSATAVADIGPVMYNDSVAVCLLVSVAMAVPLK